MGSLKKISVNWKEIIIEFYRVKEGQRIHKVQIREKGYVQHLVLLQKTSSGKRDKSRFKCVPRSIIKGGRILDIFSCIFSSQLMLRTIELPQFLTPLFTFGSEVTKNEQN